MLRDRRPAHGQVRRDVADRALAAANELEHLPARRIAERVEHGRRLVRRHLR
jgi:hypothetical protein